MEQANVYLQQLIRMCVEYAPKIALALLVLVVGWIIINRISKLLGTYLKKTEYAPPEVESFIHSIVDLGLKVLLVISVAGILGIETTSIVGILAAMGFAVGLALQGNLSNFAAGVLILIMRPYRVGDEVKVQGNWLFVKEIQIFHTVFKAFDSTMTIIPNSSILSGPIQNLTIVPVRKIKVVVNVPYSEDFFKVKQLVIDAAYSFDEIDSNVKPFMFMANYGEHYFKMSLSFAVEPKNYWKVYPKLTEAVIKVLYDNKIQTAYPTGVAHGRYGESVEEMASALINEN